MSDFLPLITAALGFVACEALNIIPAIKEDEGSPSRFSWSYYFSRPKNQLLLVLNACGSAILFIARHEVVGLAGKMPILNGLLGAGTPFLMCGLIGFCGGYAVRFVSKKLVTA